MIRLVKCHAPTACLILATAVLLCIMHAAHAIPIQMPPPNRTSRCNYGINLEWSTRVGSSIFATPRIVDLMHDGQKEVLIPTFSQFLEALNGATGDDTAGFPFVHPNFKSYASPLPIDIDGDGRTEWLVATYSGELVVFNEEGKVRGVIRLPPLAMKKNWAAHRNASMGTLFSVNITHTDDQTTARDLLKARRITDLYVNRPTRRRNETQKFNRFSTQPTEWQEEGREEENEPEEDWDGEWDWVDDDDLRDDAFVEQHGIGPDARFSSEARASMNVLFHPELYRANIEDYDEQGIVSNRFIRGTFSIVLGEDEVAVDPHILSTPVITDVDGNGDVDAVIHVSYFFDSKRKASLPASIDPDEYLATAVVCVNLVTGDVKWVRVLHLSTKSDVNAAYGLSTPLVVNADQKDASVEIYVTSTVGSIMALSGTGVPLSGNWPIWMGPITASPAAEDVRGDGQLGICVGDMNGRVACYTSAGEVIWERKVIGGVSSRVSFGDVDGDGHIDVVFGTTSGIIYFCRGRDGSTLPNTPIVTRGSIVAPVLLVDIRSYDGGLQAIVPSHDGHVYIVNSRNGCIETIDIDEKSSSMVLADDLTGNGMLDLLVTTINGGVYVFETNAKYHPMKAWPSETKGINGFTASENYVGIYIPEEYREQRDIKGDRFTMQFTIEDQRKNITKRSYDVSVFIGSRVRVFKGTFTEPKTYTFTVRSPLERMYSSVSVVLTLPNGQVFTDSISLSFNMHFLETVKFLLIVPFLAVSTALMLVKKRHEVTATTQPQQRSFL